MIVCWIVLGVLVLWLIFGLVVFLMASRSPEPAPLDNMEKLEKRIGNTHAGLVRLGLDWMRKNPPQELTMKSFDGLTLRGRWIPVKNARGTMILFHGWHGSAETDLSCVFPIYHGLGLNLLFVDQRAQNGSSGRFMTFGVMESRDAGDWVRFHNEHFGSFPVILDGISMGGSTVLMAMGRKLPDNVRGILADSSFSSPWEIIADVFRKATHLPPWIVMGAVRIWCILLAGYDPKAHSTTKAMKGSRLPVLMIHGLADSFVPYAMSQATYDAYQGKKELVLIEEAGHGMSYVVDKDRCGDALERFFDDVLGQKER